MLQLGDRVIYNCGIADCPICWNNIGTIIDVSSSSYEIEWDKPVSGFLFERARKIFNCKKLTLVKRSNEQFVDELFDNILD